MPKRGGDQVAELSSGRQIKAGRALLGWTQEQLSERASLHKNAVKYWEARETIKGQSRDNSATARMRDALNAAGVRFVDGGAVMEAA